MRSVCDATSPFLGARCSSRLYNYTYKPSVSDDDGNKQAAGGG